MIIRCLKSFVGLFVAIAFIACVGHCVVEQAYGLDVAGVNHCETEDSDHHHHESVCISKLSLVTSSNFVFGLAIPVVTTFFRVDSIDVLEVVQSAVVVVSDPATLISLLCDLTLSPNAPPA